MVFFILFAIPLLVALFGLVFMKGVTLKEFGVQLGVQALVAGCAAGIVSCQSTLDTEVWNGSVVRKNSEQVSCSHSYQCNCITTQHCDSKGNCTSTTTCQTCYDHAYDVDWNVYTSNGEELQIERVDRQGVDEPPRYSRVLVGEPTTIEHQFKNYIKASPDSLFRRHGLVERYKSAIPKYPEVYDYYRIDRLILVGGVQVPDFRAWNDALSRLNAEVGRSKQANVMVVLVRGQSQDYFYGLEEAWLGGKKNDIILVVGVDDGLVPQWATVMCWTTQELFKVKLRDDVLDGGELTKDKLVTVLKADVVKYFARKPMADFQYLEASITPSPLQWTGSILLSLVIAIGLTVYFAKNDPFGDDGREGYRYREVSFRRRKWS